LHRFRKIGEERSEDLCLRPGYHVSKEMRTGTQGFGRKTPKPLRTGETRSLISSKEGKFLDCNQALLEMLHYSSKEECLSIDLSNDLYINPEDRKVFQERIERDGCVEDMEVEFKKKDGRKVTVLLTGYPLRDVRGDIVAYEGINLDITERKRIEEELRETNEFFRNLIESSVDGIIATDMKGTSSFLNKGAEDLTGYSASEVIGKLHITELYPKGMAKEIMEKLRSPDYGGVGKLPPLQLTVLNKAKAQVPSSFQRLSFTTRRGRRWPPSVFSRTYDLVWRWKRNLKRLTYSW